MGKCVDLKISSDRRFLTKPDGSPFFWLADTAWELFHKLNREEAAEYLLTRASQQFTVIQAVALAEFDGLSVPNAYGKTPLLKNDDGNFDPELPDSGSGGYGYWEHVNYIIDAAECLGLYIRLLPAWGDKFNLLGGAGPVIFTPENAYIYGQWIGKRYKDKSNIIWIMGGDRQAENERQTLIVKNMAKGIKEGSGGTQLMTYHPRGDHSSSEQWHGEQWLDFNMIQSGHGGSYIKNYEYVQRDYSLLPVKPTLDGEPRYEDHSINFNPENGYFDDYEVRMAAYWAVLSGAFGHTYGHHSIWSFAAFKDEYKKYFSDSAYFIMDWRAALHRPGAENMKYVKELFLSRPFLELTPCQKLLSENYSGANYIAAAKGRKYAFIYIPSGLEVKINMKILNGENITAQWFDPRKGVYMYAGMMKNEGVAAFEPPSSGRNNDWVLVLDSAENKQEDVM
jgi:hypothetical protein